MTPEEYEENVEENNGFCTTCKKITVFGGCEPDAREYECPDCGNSTVYGTEEALIMGVIKIDEGSD